MMVLLLFINYTCSEYDNVQNSELNVSRFCQANESNHLYFLPLRV